MIFFKKISLFIAVVAMSITLFSFKSTNSNERNLGMAQVTTHNNNLNYQAPKPNEPWFTGIWNGDLKGAIWFVAGLATNYMMQSAFTPEQERNEIDEQYQINNL